MKMCVQVGGSTFTAALENNAAAEAQAEISFCIRGVNAGSYGKANEFASFSGSIYWANAASPRVIDGFVFPW